MRDMPPSTARMDVDPQAEIEASTTEENVKKIQESTSRVMDIAKIVFELQEGEENLATFSNRSNGPLMMSKTGRCCKSDNPKLQTFSVKIALKTIL
ncbi:hypothetical protein FRB90_005548 [Tulasnella sp. 427]|nr:hypothetical protein FRB90_005548 [Tulasnella sp. 427]